MTDSFAGPTEKPQEAISKGGSFVPLAAMATGRLVLITPVSLELDVESEFIDDKTGDKKRGARMVAHIAVLSGETEFYWEDGKGEAQEFSAEELPHVFEDTFINSAPLIDRTEDARRVDLSATMSLGRLVKPKAYGLRPPSDKDVAVARKWLATPEGKTFATTAQELHDARVTAVNTPPSADATPFD